MGPCVLSTADASCWGGERNEEGFSLGKLLVAAVEQSLKED